MIERLPASFEKHVAVITRVVENAHPVGSAS
jgi:hypothetical protein